MSSEPSDQIHLFTQTQQTYMIPPGRFPVRKAFNEMRLRWEDVIATSRGETGDLAECSYASTPLVTHGAWRGHTFASAAMHTFYKQNLHEYMEELHQLKGQPDLLRMRTRGRKSKKTAYLIDAVNRLKVLKSMTSELNPIQLIEDWSLLIERA